ncbi:REP-associated tyrosine transposase [Cerasicoccus fimbriatus]|uniref:REP-associated tyrosine transposase n=1 Tax=Cerasicoccus fimbriatus TaxID=3014554 RepID=UPI0022B323DD|nr:transposase [Cerasicoccus sp. TK19100]
MKIPDFKRKKLDHASPDWVAEDSIYFITINTDPPGRNQLANPDTATAVFEAAKFYHQGNRWYVHLLLLMPDHLHALLTFNHRDFKSSRLIQAWKSYLAKNQAIIWQDRFFDHRIRSDEEYVLKADYIRKNPLRADLIAKDESWPFCWHADSFRS